MHVLFEIGLFTFSAFNLYTISTLEIHVILWVKGY